MLVKKFGYTDVCGSNVRDGEFCVKDVRNLLDVTFLPKADSPTRWIKTIPIKVNIFAWKVSLDRLPTRSNLARMGVLVPSSSCLICNVSDEDLAHLLFRCDLAIEVTRLVYRWWNLVWIPLDSYISWLSWIKALRMNSRSKSVLEGFLDAQFNPWLVVKDTTISFFLLVISNSLDTAEINDQAAEVLDDQDSSRSMCAIRPQQEAQCLVIDSSVRSRCSIQTPVVVKIHYFLLVISNSLDTAEINDQAAEQG
ncbi:RNA-directed DNA polymerase, eukaryota, partial [Tanacetum coccineum]